MSVNMEVQEARDEEDRILEFMRERPEGASYFAVTTELGIARTKAVSILERLNREGRLSFDCKTKLYFPAATLRPERPEEGARGLEDRPVPSRIRCPIEGCGVELKATWSNVYVHLRKRHMLSLIEVRARLEQLLPGQGEGTASSAECRYCGRKFKNSSGRAGHEQRCMKNPALAPKAGGTPTGLETLTKVENDPASPEEQVPCPCPESDRNTMSASVPAGESGTVRHSGAEADPLALFAQRHRVRVGREISKLRKVERRLRRHAASANAMADRVKAARRIKERELRRFERELTGMT